MVTLSVAISELDDKIGVKLTRQVMPSNLDELKQSELLLAAALVNAINHVMSRRRRLVRISGEPGFGSDLAWVQAEVEKALETVGGESAK